MANQLTQTLIKLNLATDDCAFREGDVEEEGAIPDIKNEIIRPAVQTQLQRWLLTRKRPFSPPIKKQAPSENGSFEEFESPTNRNG